MALSYILIYIAYYYVILCHYKSNNKMFTEKEDLTNAISILFFVNALVIICHSYSHCMKQCFIICCFVIVTFEILKQHYATIWHFLRYGFIGN